jgi:hypothetical protein
VEVETSHPNSVVANQFLRPKGRESDDFILISKPPKRYKTAINPS